MQFCCMKFELSERLRGGGYDFGRVAGCRLLLKNNSLYPWFVLVPEVGGDVEELTDLSEEMYADVMQQVRVVSMFVREYFGSEKVNVGCVGIVVRQLHLHVVGRTEGDAAWPGVVWGAEGKEIYKEERVAEIKSAWETYLEGREKR